MSKHTLGPWVAETDSWFDTILRTDHGDEANMAAGRACDEDIAVATSIEWGVDDAEEIAANARLIAAAPDLLEMAKWAEAAIAPFSKEPAEKSGIARLRAAIAKAEGR